ncbi:AF4/FMR2 family member 3 [Trichinella pseudospiralis]|uniref:AF4/FMR2 family member lilli n=1 Tax=Trichinella pseudospiralis TaxID=6337 RepID=A0A0V1KDG7_TRIPS|nr:AF4/FMR2 family member 3 [Trichinella pseudospiralis]
MQRLALQTLTERRFRSTCIMQEREALRRQAEEARRSGAAKVASKPQEHLSCAPVFDPPIRLRDNNEDSLHVRLKRSLGSFEEVSSYLFNGMKLPGVDCRPVQSRNDSSLENGIQTSQAEAKRHHACETYKNCQQHPQKHLSSSTSRGKSSMRTSPVVKSLKTSPTKNGSKHHKNDAHRANAAHHNSTSKHCTDSDPLSGCLDDLSHCPLEVATLIKKVQEMIPAPLTAISTPRQDRKCDFKKSEQQQYLNGYSCAEEQQRCNGVASNKATISATNADYYYYDQQQQQAIKATTVIDAFGKKSLSTTTSNNVELAENSLKRESSFSVLNRDLELSEDSDSDSEESDDTTSSTKLSDTVSDKVESLSESEQRRCTTTTTTSAAIAAVANTTSTITAATINNCNTGSKNMLETSPFSEAGSETKEESKEAPENPWDIDYLISKILFPKVPGSENDQLMNGGGLLSPIPNHHCNGKAMDEDYLQEEADADVKEQIDSLFEEKKKNVGKISKKSKTDTTTEKGSLMLPVATKSRKRSKAAAKVEKADELSAGEQMKVEEKFEIPVKIRRKSAKCKSNNNKLNNEELSNVKCENDHKQIPVPTTSSHINNNSSSVVMQSRMTNVVDTILKEIKLPAPLSPIRDLKRHPKENKKKKKKKKSLKCLLNLQLVRKVPTPVFEKAKQCGVDLKLETKSDNVKIKKDLLKHSKLTDHSTSKEQNCCYSDRFEAKAVEKHNHTTTTTTTTTTNNSNNNNNNNNDNNNNTGTVDDFPKIRTELDEKFIKERVKRTLECLKNGTSSSLAVDSKRDTPLTNGIVPIKNSSSTTQAKTIVGTEEAITTTATVAATTTATAQAPATVVKRPTSPVTSGTIDQSAKNQVDSPKRKATTKIEQAEMAPAKKSRTDNFMQNCLAAAPLLPFKLKYDDTVDPTKYLHEAKTVKHSADAEATDKSLRIITYLESICYFMLTGNCMLKSLSAESSRPYVMFKETGELLKNVSEKYLAQASLSTDPYVKFLAPKVEVLTLRIQAVLCRRLFELRQPQVFNNYRHINQYQQQIAKDGNRQCCSGNPYTGNGQVSEQHLAPACTGAGGGGSGAAAAAAAAAAASGASNANASGGAVVVINNTSHSCQPSPCRPPSACAHSPTPSPASSTGSAHSLPPGLVAIPQNVENLYKQQLSHLHNLMWSHHYWMLIEKKLNSQHGQFFSHVDSVCGALNFTCSIQELCVFVLTSVHWLRQFHLACQQKTFSNGFNPN